MAADNQIMFACDDLRQTFAKHRVVVHNQDLTHLPIVYFIQGFLHNETSGDESLAYRRPPGAGRGTFQAFSPNSDALTSHRYNLKHLTQ